MSDGEEGETVGGDEAVRQGFNRERQADRQESVQDGPNQACQERVVVYQSTEWFALGTLGYMTKYIQRVDGETLAMMIRYQTRLYESR
jgi:hypothetical protein